VWQRSALLGLEDKMKGSLDQVVMSRRISVASWTRKVTAAAVVLVLKTFEQLRRVIESMPSGIPRDLVNDRMDEFMHVRGG
jgi:hypothetical protein